MRTEHDSPTRQRRVYRSELRAAQAQDTRHRILDAVTALLEDQPERLSLAGVARAARVSLPTVHRHFPSRRDLFEAYRLHVEGSEPAGGKTARVPTTMAGMAPAIRGFFRRFDDPGDPIGGMRRLGPSLAWEFSREVTVPRRQQWATDVIAAHCPELGAADRQRFSDLMVVLVSASMAEALRGYLNRSAGEVADRVIWAVDALLAHAKAQASKPRVRGGRS
jgi:AcrR family transcriptional regulator